MFQMLAYAFGRADGLLDFVLEFSGQAGQGRNGSGRNACSVWPFGTIHLTSSIG